MNSKVIFFISACSLIVMQLELTSAQSLFQLKNMKYDKPSKIKYKLALANQDPDVLCMEYKDFLSNIILKYLEKLRAHMSTGIPSMGIPPLDPLSIENTTFEASKPYQIDVDGEVVNTLVEGLKTFNVTHISTSILHLQANITMQIPYFFITGKYNLEGHLISILPVSGNGPYTLQPQNMVISVTSTLRMENKRLQITSMNFDLDMTGIFVKFDGIYGGGFIGRLFNKIMNRFGLGIFHRIEGQIHEQLRTFLITTINEKLKDMPLMTMLQSFDERPACQNAILKAIVDNSYLN